MKIDGNAAAPSAASSEPIPGGRHAIVVSTYNDAVTGKLHAGALATLQAAGIADEDIISAQVPGAWELPLAAKWLADDPRVISIIALGAVIKGETTHDEHINRGVSLALMDIMTSSGKPVALGLLTCNTQAQAEARAGGDVGNKGEEAAQAVLAMLRLKGLLRSSS